jgi:amino acid transporter
VKKCRTPSVGLIRGLSRGHLVALHINGIVGAGILGLPSTAFAMSGAYSLAAWIVCAGLVAGIASCLAEVSSRYEQSGGPYLIALDAFGPSIGFITGWLTWVSRVLAVATICGLLSEYAGVFADWTTRGAGRIALVTVIISTITALLLAGIRQTAWVSTSLTAGKIAFLAAFAIAAYLMADTWIVTAGRPPSLTSFATTVSVMLFAFFGFENGSIAAGETDDPQRNVPFAILTSIALAAALYVLVQYACMLTLPGLSESRRPVADAAVVIFGSSGGSGVAAGAIVLMLGTLLSQMIGTTRTLMAMGEQEQLPSFIATLHRGRRVPVFATLVTAGAALAATVFSTFTTALTITVVTRVLTYSIVCLALPVLRRRQHVAPAFRLGSGPAIALMSAALSVWLIVTAASPDIAATAAVAGLGWIVWRGGRAFSA